MKPRSFACLLVLSCPLLLAGFAAAQQTAITYQGVLTNGGSPVNGTVSVVARLYDVASGGSPIAADVIGSVAISNGLLTIDPDFGAAAFSGAQRWIEFEVDSQVLSPRQAVRPAPYAIRALSSEQWASNGSAITNQNTGFVGINRSNTVGAEWFGVNAPVSAGYGGMYITTDGGNALPFYGYRTGIDSGTPQTAWTYLHGASGSFRINVDGDRLTVADNGNVGIGTVVPNYPLDVSADSALCIVGRTSSTSGVGVQGDATSVSGGTTGVKGIAWSPSGTGVFGVAAPNTGATIGVRGEVYSPTGYAAYFTGPPGSRNFFERWVGIGTDSPQAPLHAVNTGSSNAVYGENNGSGAGVHGSNSGTGAGVIGLQTATTGIRSGVVGQSDSNAGRGVFGWATSPIGNAYGVQAQTDSNAGRAVYALSTANTGTTYGVRAEINSASGYSGYFAGPVGSQNYFQQSVGIGTLSPASTLSVAGTADISGPVSIGITGADARLLVRGIVGEDAFRVRVDTATKFLVKDNGGVGIGSNFGTLPANGLRTLGAVGVGADPGAFMFAVSGDAAKPGGGLWSAFSDARLKHDIQPLAHGSLDRLLSLNGYTFIYDDQAIENRLALPGVQTGLIAQEVQQVFPEWVDADEDGYLYVTERGLTAIIVESMRELREEKDEEIANLQQQISELRELIMLQAK